MADSSKRTARKPAALSSARAATGRRAAVTSSAKSAPAKKAATKAAPAKKAPAKKAPAKQAAPKAAATRAPATKIPVKKAAVKRTSATAAPKQATPKQATPKRAARQRAAATRVATSTPKPQVTRRATARKPSARPPAESPSALQQKKDPLNVDTAQSLPDGRAAAPEGQSVQTAQVPPTPTDLGGASAHTLPVRDGEDPWTEDEVAELVAELESDVARQRAQIEIVDTELAGLLRDGNDGAGRDPADVGSTNFERDQEMSIAANSRGLLDQSVDALQRIASGRFGICANCGQPIGKGRLQAFPRAVLCVTCKQREERR